jgi:hypothetical protein
MRFPMIPGLLARGLRYLDDEFQNATGLATGGSRPWIDRL